MPLRPWQQQGEGLHQGLHHSFNADGSPYRLTYAVFVQGVWLKLEIWAKGGQANYRVLKFSSSERVRDETFPGPPRWNFINDLKTCLRPPLIWFRPCLLFKGLILTHFDKIPSQPSHKPTDRQHHEPVQLSLQQWVRAVSAVGSVGSVSNSSRYRWSNDRCPWPGFIVLYDVRGLQQLPGGSSWFSF